MSDKRRKLTAKQVSEIRLLSAKGKSNPEIAAKYGRDQNTIWLIVTGKTWKSKAPLTCPHCHKAI